MVTFATTQGLAVGSTHVMNTNTSPHGTPKGVSSAPLPESDVVDEQAPDCARLAAWKQTLEGLQHHMPKHDAITRWYEMPCALLELTLEGYVPKAIAFDQIMRSTRGCPVGVEIKHEALDRWIFLSPSLGVDEAPWRVNTFGCDGFHGHSHRASVEEALAEAVSDGFRILDVGALDRVETTEAFRRGNEITEITHQVLSGEISRETYEQKRSAICAA